MFFQTKKTDFYALVKQLTESPDQHALHLCPLCVEDYFHPRKSDVGLGRVKGTCAKSASARPHMCS